MSGWLLGLIAGMVANELGGYSEWAARWLAAWSARVRYKDPERAKIRSEELDSLIAARPGQLLKLITALCFAVAAACAWAAHIAAGLAAFSATGSAETALVLTRRVTIIATVLGSAAE
jgi:hypothetical protein